MTERIIDYEAFDIDAGLDPAGEAVLALVTDKGRVGVLMKRTVLEALFHRIKRELERVPAPYQKR